MTANDFDFFGVQHRPWHIIKDCDCGGDICGSSDTSFGVCIVCGKQMPWDEMVKGFVEQEAREREKRIK